MKLLRSGIKGNYVLFPKEWGKRWLSPQNRRFQTGCDMVVGGCSCGRNHHEDDEETEDILASHDATIESMHEWRERTREQRIASDNESITTERGA